jgi:hypothetical protein
MNLASVLHYLQSEWRRWERDRNEWEIERAEMRVGHLCGKLSKLDGSRCFVNRFFRPHRSSSIVTG